MYNIQESDTGRYICQMTTADNIVTQNYVDVRLRREYRKRRHSHKNNKKSKNKQNNKKGSVTKK